MRARLLFLTVVLFGCSAGTDVENPEHVAAWANSASALAVFIPAYEPIGVADGEVVFEDPACPSVEDDGTTVVLTGGCTNTEGKRWEGTATVVRGVGGAYELTLEGYGSADQEDTVPRITGTFSIRRTDDGAHTFDADYVQDGLLTVDVDYEGSVRGDYDSATLWNGTGTVTRGGFTDASGTATATTVDQLRDGAICSNQAASGTTTLEIGGRTVVVEYDGATDCDDDYTARFSVDGEDHGAVEGITCAASTPGRRGSWALLVPLAAAALIAIRRRSARVRGG